MSGYTPVFDTVFQGTLCGKYPDLPVWLVLLALQQRGGIIDAHPSYIATISGLPQADIEAAIKRFCEPDPASRTPDNDGRRLEPLEGAGFGWRVLNHRKYAEKARKLSSDAARAADGTNAARMAGRKDADPRRPAQTRADPPSDSDANKDKNIVGCADQHRVFGHWKTVHNHPTAKLDGKRSRLIAAALKNYTADQLCACIDGYKQSEFHQGKNKDGKVYDSLSLMLRDAEHIDAGIKMAQGGQQKWL